MGVAGVPECPLEPHRRCSTAEDPFVEPELRLHVRAGRVSFAVALTARAREALRRHGRLPLTARLLISAPTGASVTIARKLLMRP